MKAIFAKYLSNTNTLPARFKAYDSDGNQVTISSEAIDNVDDGYRFAADALVKKMKWENCGTLVSGSHGNIEVFVFTS